MKCEWEAEYGSGIGKRRVCKRVKRGKIQRDNRLCGIACKPTYQVCGVPVWVSGVYLSPLVAGVGGDVQPTVEVLCPKEVIRG